MKILYQDDRIVVCVKPAGVLSTDEPGGMPELLRAEMGEPELAVRSVHRLDRAVGGVMVYALTRRAASDLSREVREGAFHKEYLAVIHGCPKEPSGTLRNYLHRDRMARRTVVVAPGTGEAQEAILDYELLERAGELSLLRVILRTGRTHQIRCQLSSRGWPIVGDRKYGAPEPEGNIALWSHIIKFFHPRSGQEMAFIQEVPHLYPWNRFSSVFIDE